MAFKATNDYFKNSVIPFGVYVPSHFVAEFPIVSDGGILSDLTAGLNALKGQPIDYLMASTTIPEKVIKHEIIYKYGRGISVPVGLETPHTWRCVFMVDETFSAVRYLTKWFYNSGGYGEEISFTQENDSLVTKIISLLNPANWLDSFLGPSKNPYTELRETLSVFNKRDIVVFALPKTYVDLWTINSPFGRPLNLATPMLGRIYKMCGCSIVRIGPLQMDSNVQNAPAFIEVDFLVDYIKEYHGTDELLAEALEVGSKLTPGPIRAVTS